MQKILWLENANTWVLPQKAKQSCDAENKLTSQAVLILSTLSFSFSVSDSIKRSTGRMKV
jgi:hypothetical protein